MEKINYTQKQKCNKKTKWNDSPKSYLGGGVLKCF